MKNSIVVLALLVFVALSFKSHATSVEQWEDIQNEYNNNRSIIYQQQMLQEQQRQTQIMQQQRQQILYQDPYLQQRGLNPYIILQCR